MHRRPDAERAPEPSGRGRGRALLGVLLVGVLWIGPRPALAEGPEAVWASGASGLEVQGLSSLQPHGKRSDVLYAHVHGMGIARSEDEGRTWAPIQQGIDPRHVPGPRDVCQIAADPREDDTLWLVTRGHVYRSEDAGDTWVEKTSGALASYSWDRRRNETLIRGLVVDPSRGLHALAGTRPGPEWQGGLYETTDGGKTWEQIAGSSLPKSELGADAWPILLDPSTDKNVVVGGSGGLFVSDDRGRKFKRAEPVEVGAREVRAIDRVGGRGREVLLANARGVWTSRDGGKRWGSEPALAGDAVAVASDPHARKRAFAVLRDRGVVLCDDARRQKWQDVGGAELDIHEIIFHPRDKDVVYLASPVTGLHVSRDRGETLEPVGADLPTIVPAMAAACVHPTEEARALALGAHGTVFHSSDRGETWSRGGLLGMEPTLLLGDRTAPGAYLAGGRALMRTPDNGATWTTLYVPADPDDRIVGATQLEDGTLLLLLERAHVVVKSTDGGKTFTESASYTRSPMTASAAFAVDPQEANHLLVASRSLTSLWTPKDDEGGPYESWDGGATWTRLQEGLGTPRSPLKDWNRGRVAAFDPVTGLLLYGADGLGLFARLAADPAGEKPATPPAWVQVPLPLPEAQIAAFSLVPGETPDATSAVLQLVGENSTRAMLRAPLERLRALVTAAAEEREKLGSPWTPLPDAGARLSSLSADPLLPGRLLATDATTTAGVLVYGVPGARPTAPAAPPKAPAPPAPPPGEKPPENPAEEPAATQDGQKPPVALLAYAGCRDGLVRIWDLHEQKQVGKLEGHTAEVVAVTLSPDESVLATAGRDRLIRLWNGGDGSPLGTLSSAEGGAVVTCLAFSPDGTRLYAGTEGSGEIVEWNVETRTMRRLSGHTGAVRALALTPDGTALVSAGADKTVRCWDPLAALETHKAELTSEPLSLGLRADGHLAFVGLLDGSVTVLDVRTGTVTKTAKSPLTSVRSVAVSPGGDRLLVAGAGGVRVLDATSLEGLAAHGGPETPVTAAAYTKDARWVVAADEQGGMWVWAADAAAPHFHAQGAQGEAALSLALTPDVEDAPAGPEGGAGDAAPPK